jgi:hypothetical protein
MWYDNAHVEDVFCVHPVLQMLDITSYILIQVARDYLMIMSQINL